MCWCMNVGTELYISVVCACWLIGYSSLRDTQTKASCWFPLASAHTQTHMQYMALLYKMNYIKPINQSTNLFTHTCTLLPHQNIHIHMDKDTHHAQAHSFFGMSPVYYCFFTFLFHSWLTDASSSFSPLALHFPWDHAVGYKFLLLLVCSPLMTLPQLAVLQRCRSKDPWTIQQETALSVGRRRWHS